jgi:hypothetical protein
MRSLLSRLRPTEKEVHELARRETDPRLYAQFTAIARGPVVAVLALLGLGLVAIVCTPFWWLRRRSQAT